MQGRGCGEEAAALDSEAKLAECMMTPGSLSAVSAKTGIYCKELRSHP